VSCAAFHTQEFLHRAMPVLLRIGLLPDGMAGKSERRWMRALIVRMLFLHGEGWWLVSKTSLSTLQTSAASALVMPFAMTTFCQSSNLLPRP